MGSPPAILVVLVLSAATDPKPLGSTWMERADLKVEGLRAAETFRRQLLEPGEQGVAPIEDLAESLSLFQRRSRSVLKNRPGLDGFADAATLCRSQSKAAEPVPNAGVFKAFQGRWFGDWDGMKVDHDWGATIRFEPALHVRGDLPSLRAEQFAWVGDGFGWNWIATPTNATGEVVLGMVYHLDPKDGRTITARRPHLGIVAGPRRLIWITAGEAFFEEGLPAESATPDRYAITGFRYRRAGRRVEIQGNAFQAIYTRDANRRPAFHTFAFPEN